MKYTLKQIPQDFIVHEVSFLPTTIEKKGATYTYVYVEKMGYTTFQLQKILARRFKLPLEDVSFQGLKDEDGLTIQLFSIKKILREKDIKKVKKIGGSYYSIRSIFGYGKEPLQNKALHGNTFTLTIRNLSSPSTNKILERCKDKHFSFINYYDEQRFGMPHSPHNTHLIGKALIQRDFTRAYREYLRSGNEIPTGVSKIDPVGLFKKIPSNFLTFIISAYNSYLWNIHTSQTIENKKTKLINFKNVGELYVPKEKVFISQNISTCDGYMVNKDLTVQSKKVDRPGIVNTSLYITSSGKDELNKGKHKITLSFFLPTGSYATMAIKQLMVQNEIA